MAKEFVDIHDVGREEGFTWLPTYVLNHGIDHEVCGDYGNDHHHHQLLLKRRSILNDGIEACGEEEDNHLYSKRSYNKHRHQPPYSRKSSIAAHLPLLSSPSPWKSYSKTDQKPKHTANWAAGGPGMQAVFLDSSQRSCGTGVFLPRTGGNDVEKPRKPPFAPVLLPSRVVQALNLNVHGLGLQIKPKEHNNNIKGIECDRIRNKKSRDVPSQICVISQNRGSSPEIFLPKEWTY